MLHQLNQLQLHYFDIRGYGEVPRLLLTIAGANWTDDRISFQLQGEGKPPLLGDWADRKEKTPYGQVPVLTLEDGTQIAQSGSIKRFIAARYGLNGSNATEAGLIDAACETMHDIRNANQKANDSKDDAKKAEFVSKTLPETLARLEKNATGSSGHFVGSKVSIADVQIYYMFFQLATEHADATAKLKAANPKLQAIADGVEKNEKIVPYLAARKQYPF